MNPSSGNAPCLLPAHTEVAGSLTAPGNAVIAGVIQGDLRAAGHVQLEASARVAGHVYAAQITLHGCVDGSVFVDQETELHPGGRVGGVLTTGRLTTCDGAFYEGRVVLGVTESTESADNASATTTPPPLPHPAPDALVFQPVPGATHAGLRRRPPAAS